jgi:hypothetical protein
LYRPFGDGSAAGERPYTFAAFWPRIFRFAACVSSGYPQRLRISSGISKRQSASICHCGDP